MAWGTEGVDSLDWVLASVASGVGVPLSWKMWYWRLYKSARDGANVGSVAFVLHLAFAIAWALWMFISVPELGEMGGGIFPMLRAFGAGTTWLGLLCFFNVLVWGLAVILSVWVLRAVRTIQTGRPIQFYPDARVRLSDPRSRGPRMERVARGAGAMGGMRLSLMSGGMAGLFLRPCDRVVQAPAVRNGGGAPLGGGVVPPVHGGDV